MGNQTNETTHKYSRTYFTVKIISALFLGTIIIVIAFVALQGNMRDSDNAFLYGLGIFGVTALVTTLVHVFGLNRVYDTLSTKSYITNELQTKVSYADAVFLKKIFEPAYIKSEEWVSMKNVIALPEDMRRKVVMDTANKILAYKKRIGKK